MVRNAVLLALVLIALVAIGSGWWGADEVAYCGRAASGAEPSVTIEAPQPRSVLSVPPEQMRDAVRDGYQLSPDKRFLLAIAEIDCLYSALSPGEIRASFRDDKWIIHYRDELVGELPPLADYPEAKALLVGWIDRMAERHPIEWRKRTSQRHLRFVREQVEAFEASAVAMGLRRLDKRVRRSGWHPELVRLAATGLVYLNLQSSDGLEIGDRLPAKAFALVTLAGASGSGDVAADESLLAYMMGYGRHAEAMAMALSRHDPVRLYVNRETDLLRNAAEQPGSLLRDRYLYLLRLAVKTRNIREWSAWLDQYWPERQLSLPIIKSGMMVGRYASRGALPEMGAYRAVIEVRQAVKSGSVSRRMLEQVTPPDELGDLVAIVRQQLGLEPPKLVDRFEVELDQLNRSYDGPVLDAATYRTYFKAHFYSAMYAGAQYRIGSRWDRDRVETALQSASSDVGIELRHWYNYLAAAEDGEADIENLLWVLNQSEHLGVPAVRRILSELKEQTAGRRLEMARQFVRRLDSRVAHQKIMGNLALNDVRDLVAAERYYERVVDLAASDDRFLEVWMAKFTGDLNKLLAIIDNTALDRRTREYALRNLIESAEADDEVIKQKARQLIREFPQWWEPISTYVDFLEGREEYREALPVVREWLNEHGPSDGFPYIFAMSAMARMHYYLGEYETALKFVEPVTWTRQAGAMGRAALVLQRLHRGEEALQLARRVVSQYPNSAWGRSVLAEVLWSQRRYEEVAPVLYEDGHALDTWDWRNEVGNAFLSVFGDRPLRDATAAFGAMIEGGIPSWVLEKLPDGIHRAGRSDIAFALQAQLNTTRAVGSLRHPIDAYGYLVAWRGDRSEALRWIRAKIPSNRVNPSSLLMFWRQQYDLLWDAIAHPEAARYSEVVWLMRAAAFVRTGQLAPARRSVLYEHYRGQISDDYFMMGRYLLGLEDEQAMFALATSPDRRCEIAFYIGLKAQAEGRYEEASDWYRVARETEQSREYEHIWATQTLSDWSNPARSLKVVAAQRN